MEEKGGGEGGNGGGWGGGVLKGRETGKDMPLSFGFNYGK